MLKGDAFRIEQFKDDLSKLGQRFVDKGNLQGATFVYATYQMADHNLPKEHENLKVRCGSRMHALQLIEVCRSALLASDMKACTLSSTCTESTCTHASLYADLEANT